SSLQSARALPHLASFPTRRSSDLLRFGPARIEDELHADLDQLLRRDAEVQSTLQMLHELPFHPLRRECGAGHHAAFPAGDDPSRSEEHTSELQSRENLVCRLLLEK